MPSLQDMPPDFATDNSAYARMVVVKPFGNFTSTQARFSKLPYFLNIGFFEDRLRKGFTPALAILFLHVLHVVQNGSKKKMLRITAAFHVALVKHLGFLWYFSVGKFPAYAVGATQLSFKSKITIAITNASFPNPAAVRLGDFFKKTLFECFVSLVVRVHKKTSRLAKVIRAHQLPQLQNGMLNLLTACNMVQSGISATK
jgi:hypothetical protein